MKLFLVLALVLCTHAADVKEKEDKAEPTNNKDKRQTQDELVPSSFVYRNPRKQEQVAPVQEPQEDDKRNEEYRPGQVFSLNAQELLELQPERKAPVANDQLLQQLYSSPQQDHQQNLQQQIYYLEPQQVGRQVSLQPSHAVIARPHFSSNGGEASVGAALSVSDSGANPSESFDQELLALLGHQVRQEERPQYSQQQPIQQTSAPNLLHQQHQQVERYITKPTKKATKLRNKIQITPPQSSTAPQQYLIETTNVQQQQQQQQQSLQQYRTAPQLQAQAQRPVHALRYVTVPQPQPVAQQVVYERPETQGLKVVPAPKLQQLQQQRPQLAYRILPQYQQQEASPKQYRILESPRQPLRQEQRASSVERPITYLKRYPEPEKMRAVKIYDPVDLPSPQQPAQIIGEQYYLRPVYRQNEQQRPRYDLPMPLRQVEQRPIESTKPPSSAIYVSKNIAPKKIVRPQPIRQDHEQSRHDQNLEHYSIDHQNLQSHQSHQSLEEQRAQLPPPRNNKAYTPEEFAALVAAGYSVTPVPVSAHVAQSRSSVEVAPAHLQRRPIYRRPQYLPIRDDAP